LAKKREDLPVYLFTGFLESGKTKFIQETLEDKRFCNGERTLLLVCEEGEEEYAPDCFADKNVFLKSVEAPEELTGENLEAWADAVDADRVVIEYNGMWLLDVLYNAMPESWMVYQEFMFVDTTSFISYNNNMRQLMFDKLKSAELVIFNRYSDSYDKQTLHNVVRGASRRADIAYEYVGGNVVYDEIEDPLPFDIDAPIVEIGEEDYAIWYRDMSEDPAKYDGKTLRFKCRTVTKTKSRLPRETFVVGRHVMACCEADTQFAALVCQSPNANEIEHDSWITLTAKLNFKFSRAYGKKGPVLTMLSWVPANPPVQPVATFY